MSQVVRIVGVVDSIVVHPADHTEVAGRCAAVHRAVAGSLVVVVRSLVAVELDHILAAVNSLK